LGFYERCLYDVAWIYAKAVLLASKTDPMAVKPVLPDVASEHFGVTGWCNLNAAGDRSKSDYEIWGVDGNVLWITYGLYDMFTGKVTWYTDLGISPPGQ